MAGQRLALSHPSTRGLCALNGASATPGLHAMWAACTRKLSHGKIVPRTVCATTAGAYLSTERRTWPLAAIGVWRRRGRWMWRTAGSWGHQSHWASSSPGGRSPGPRTPAGRHTSCPCPPAREQSPSRRTRMAPRPRCTAARLAPRTPQLARKSSPAAGAAAAMASGPSRGLQFMRLWL